ncbi:unnamed protein product [Nesidiocoris tenuis]|uniref:Uncharacterized protein n=1 Tax=Nesidiocoris tenuis TaxID=355587 RepID=A0A6H5HRM4_9HEMI|nr:unnamed protein product [Nesidiocoris tenuis]
MDLWDGQQPYVEARALALPELQQEHNKREVFPHLSLPTGWPGHYVVLWMAACCTKMSSKLGCNLILYFPTGRYLLRHELIRLLSKLDQILLRESRTNIPKKATWTIPYNNVTTWKVE